MAGRMKKKIQNLFRCTGTARGDWSYERASKRMIFQGTNENFIVNGGLLLEERVTLFHGKTNSIHCLTVGHLNTNFEDWILYGEFGAGSWYKCVWEQRLVLVKLYSKGHDRYQKQFCREIAIATQMGIHKNVHKLLACCLETKLPVLIYEYVEVGSLRDRIVIDKNQNKPPLEWKDRLRIAWEISHAIAYLHFAFPRPIIHRDLIPFNVYLDQHNAAKLADFSFSVSIPEGKTALEVDTIEGTYDYVPPEYLLHGIVTEAFDVHSFGVLFLELLSGQKFGLMDYSDDESSRSIPRNVRLREFLKENIGELITWYRGPTLNEDLLCKQLYASIELGLSCIEVEADSRPTMVEVAAELKNMISSFESSIPTTNSGAAE